MLPTLATDNQAIIFPLLRNMTARFDRSRIGDRTYYVALNRAARRFLRSNKIKRLAKEQNLELDLELNSIS